MKSAMILSQNSANKFRLTLLIGLTFLSTLLRAQTTDTLWTEKWEGDWTQNWHVDAGTWDAGIPTSGPGKPYRGQKCAATVLNGNYSEPAETRLIRHTSFVVPNKDKNPRLRFWHWYNFSSGDFGEVQVSTDGGVKWTPVSTSYASTGSGLWTYPFIDLSAYAGLNVQIAFRFHAHQAGCCGPDVSTGWYIDDVALITGPLNLPDNFVEGFESGIGNWASERGTWEVGKPTTGPAKAFAGQNVAATVLTGNYSEPVDSRLISPPFTVPSKNKNPRLRFWHWYSFSGGDYGEVQIKVGSEAWKAISTTYSSTGSGIWTYPLIDLSAYTGMTVQIAFFFHSHQAGCCGPDLSSGWYIDEVALIQNPIVFRNPETFESGMGDWAAERGTWEIGTPARGVGPDTAYSRPNCAATVLAGNYSEPVDSRLISPPFVVPSANKNPALRFRHWYSFSGGDYGEVQIRIRNGSWQRIPTTIQFVNTSGGTWPPFFASLTSFADSTVQIAFFFHSHQAGCCGADLSTGWYVDNIQIDPVCTYSISSTSPTFPSGGGSGSVTVTADAGCSWTAVSNNDTWIHIISGNSGSGNGTVNYSVDPNSSPSPRTGTIAIAGTVDTVKQAGKPSGIPISPVATSPQFATQEFWVDVKVGDSASPVTNLFGASFCLTFTNTNFIDVVTPYASTVIPGDFLGSDVVFQSNVDETAGKVCIGISRKAGQGGVSGNGTLARIKVIANSTTPDKTPIQFCVTEVIANDPNGNSISLTPVCPTVTINKCLTVWPGDTNNDGKIDQVDVLPIGLYWGRTGSVCASPSSCAWSARCCTPWSPSAATYADANGDGVVNQVDVLCIGLNWNKTHSTNFSLTSGAPLSKTGSVVSASLAPEVKSVQAPNQEFFVRLKASEVNDLFGLSFELLYDQRNYMRIIAVEPDSLFGSDVVFYSNVDTTAGKIAVGISRKAGQAGITGTGFTVRVKAMISTDAPNGTTIHFSLQNVVGNDANGASIQLVLGSSNTTVLRTAVVSENEMSIPADYRLEQNYPNPFNPSTSIEFALPRTVQVMLKIFNLNGQEVATLVDEQLPAGRYKANWDASSMQAGTYFYQLQAEGFTHTKKLTFVK